MGFFNRKEEVLDLQLTPHGKYLLSKGKMKPEYYAFFDDDILYDREYAGPDEVQNDISDRIKTTARPRTQYNFRGIETEVVKNIEDIRQNRAAGFSDEMRTQQAYAVKHVLDAMPIGTSQLGNEKAPAWQVYFLKGEISGSDRLYSPDATLQKYTPPVNIPQIQTDVIYETAVREHNPLSTSDVENDEADQGFLINGQEGYQFEDGSEVYVKDKQFLVIELIEENSEFLSSNFDIEVFKVEEIKDGNGNNTGQENLIPLYFHKEPMPAFYVDKNNILVENSTVNNRQRGSELFSLDTDMVEYYLQIDTDGEIDEEIMCELDPPDTAKGIYSRRLYECATDFNQRQNIYQPEEVPDDICDV